MSAGVYAIYLTGTRFAYVGQAKNFDLRCKQHEKRWVWPNPAEYVLVREMPGSTRQRRHKTEEALMRLLKRRGYLVLNPSIEEYCSAGGKAASRSYSREKRQESWKVLSPDARKRRLRGIVTSTIEQRRTAGLASVKTFTREQLTERGRKGIRAMREKFTPEQHSTFARSGGKASAASSKPNSGRFTSDRLRGVPFSAEHRQKISLALIARRTAS